MNQEEADRKFLLAASEELEDYLSSTQLIWRLDQNAIPLTPGNLRLCCTRIDCYVSTSNDAQIQAGLNSISRILDKRAAIWQKRMEQEFPYRLGLWKNSIDDYFDDGAIDHSFSTAVKDRVILSLLINEIRFFSLENEKLLENVDTKLKGISKSGEFLWDPIYQKAFSKESFWFLYLQPIKEKNDGLLF